MGSRRPKVVFWNHVPATSAVGRFNAVARRGNLDFEVWFSQLEGTTRRWDPSPGSWEFPCRVLKEQPFLGKTIKAPFAELLQTHPDLLVASYDTVGHILGLCVASALGTRIAFRVLPTYTAWYPRKLWKEQIKHLLFTAADAAKVSGEDAKVLAMQYGMPAERISTVTQSIDFAHFAGAVALRKTVGVDLRKRLGLDGCTFIYVGRLWRGKGLDDLFEAYLKLRLTCDRVSLLIVGEGVDGAIYREKYRNTPGVRFTGHIRSDDLPGYYSAADALVFPTLGDPHGVVVEEAMAAGLPVICTTEAGDIKRRVPEGEAGFVVPVHDPDTLAKRMLRLADDPNERQLMGAKAGQVARGCGHEKYAIEFDNFVQEALSHERCRTIQAGIVRAAGTAVLRFWRGDAPATLLDVQSAASPGSSNSSRELLRSVE